MSGPGQAVLRASGSLCRRLDRSNQRCPRWRNLFVGCGVMMSDHQLPSGNFQGSNILYVFFGLIASGKSTLAEAWAQRLGINSYNSDRVRKELAGLAVNAQQRASFNAGIYTAEFSRKTYDALLAHAENELREKHSVVLDGSYQSKAERDRVREIARRHRASLIFIECRCPEPLLQERMALRAQDPSAVSDGRWEIYLLQKERFQKPDELASGELITIDTDAPVDTLLLRLAVLVQHARAEAATRGALPA